MEWSYQLLDEPEREVFRAVSVFPAGFTLEAAEAVAGPGATAVMLRLVDCSLLVPPRASPDGRARYRMLETLRTYGAELLAETGEQHSANAALAGYALRMAEEAAAGLHTTAGEADAASWLDAEDATTRQVLTWAVKHDPAVVLQLAAALGWWWLLRGRLQGQYPLLHEAAEHAEAGSNAWCTTQNWLGWTALFSADLAGSLGHFTALRDAVASLPPSWGLSNALAGRSAVLRHMGRPAEAADDARRALGLAREIGYPTGEAPALAELSLAASSAGDHHTAVQLARQAEQITVGVPGAMARVSRFALTGVLIAAGELADAERVCAAGLAWSREAGDVGNQADLLPMLAMLEVQAGRLQDAAAHLHAGLQIAVRIGSHGELIDGLDCCGYLCAATGRHAEAVTVWAALGAIRTILRHGESEEGPAEPHRQEPLRVARQALGPARARATEERGAAISLDTAAEYALMLTTPGPAPAAAPT